MRSLSEEDGALRESPSVVSVVGPQKGDPVENNAQDNTHVENLVRRSDNVKGARRPLLGHSCSVDTGSSNVGSGFQEDPRQLDSQNGSLVSKFETGVNNGETSGKTEKNKHEGSERTPFAGVELLHERNTCTDCSKREGQSPVEPSLVVTMVISVEDDAKHGRNDQRHNSQVVELVSGSGNLVRVTLDAVEGSTHAQTRDNAKHEENEHSVILPGGCRVNGETHVEVGSESVDCYSSNKGSQGWQQVRVDVDGLIVHKAKSLEGLLVTVGLLDVAASNVAVVALPGGNVVPQVCQGLLNLFYSVGDRVLSMLQDRFVFAGVCSKADLAGGGLGTGRGHGERMFGRSSHSGHSSIFLPPYVLSSAAGSTLKP